MGATERIQEILIRRWSRSRQHPKPPSMAQSYEQNKSISVTIPNGRFCKTFLWSQTQHRDCFCRTKRRRKIHDLRFTRTLLWTHQRALADWRSADSWHWSTGLAGTDRLCFPRQCGLCWYDSGKLAIRIGPNTVRGGIVARTGIGLCRSVRQEFPKN